MKIKVMFILGMLMVLASGPVFAGKAMQMWNCGLEDDATEAQVEAQAKAWVKAARKVDGGENIEAYVLFPVAVNAAGDTDLVFVVTMPTFSEWGKFWDAYPGSDAAANEDGHTFCPDSVVWEAVKLD